MTVGSYLYVVVMSCCVITQPCPVMGDWVCVTGKLHTIPSTLLYLVCTHSLVTALCPLLLTGHAVLEAGAGAVSHHHHQAAGQSQAGEDGGSECEQPYSVLVSLSLI